MSAPRILVVDDEPDVEALITQKFRRKIRNGEISFCFAHDGEHALEVLSQEPGIDIVLSDINMPRMDGLTLLDRLNDLGADLKTVMVSAYGDMTNIRTAMNRGAFDFVTKPIEFDDLETTITRTLEHLEGFRRLQQARDDAERAHATLSRYFSPNVVEVLSNDPDYLEPKGERRSATFLFTDLANFTPLVEASSSELIVTVLNRYLDGMTETIFEHGGTVMKIVGDAVQAIFGAPVEDPDHAGQAMSCALALDAFSESFRVQMQSEAVDLGHTRIGVNTGQAIIGNFGGKRFFDYTAYGDAVNIAARLEQANKVVGTRVCISQSVVDEIAEFKGRPIGTLRLKGKVESVRCYEPLPPDAAESTATAAYCDAFRLLEAEDPSARQAFAGLIGQHGEDPVTLFHLGRLLSGETGATIKLAGS